MQSMRWGPALVVLIALDLHSPTLSSPYIRAVTPKGKLETGRLGLPRACAGCWRSALPMGSASPHFLP